MNDILVSMFRTYNGYQRNGINYKNSVSNHFFICFMARTEEQLYFFKYTGTAQK